MKKSFSFIGILLCVTFMVSCDYLMNLSKDLNSVRDWFILLDYDGNPDPVKKHRLDVYDMAILDADHHPPLELFDPKTILIAYISVGEAEGYRDYWKNIRDEPWVLFPNPNWDENYLVDVRNQAWSDVLIDEVLPGIVAQGFQGLMLDTLDTAEHLESIDPKKYEGIKEGMVELVKRIHEVYPQLRLISNNGFTVLTEIAPYLSGMLVEDIYWMVDFENNSYQAVPVEDREYKVQKLNEIHSNFDLPVFDIEYLAEDTELVTKELALKNSRALGFKPYIAEKRLSRIYSQGDVT